MGVPGDIVIFPGQTLENRDCPGKTGTDGHLTRYGHLESLQFFFAWALHHIRHHLTLPVAQTLACSIVESRLDYCNAVLYVAPKSSIAKLQRVQNTPLARIVLNEPKISPLNRSTAIASLASSSTES